MVNLSPDSSKIKKEGKKTQAHLTLISSSMLNEGWFETVCSSREYNSILATDYAWVDHFCCFKRPLQRSNPNDSRKHCIYTDWTSIIKLMRDSLLMEID